MGAWGPGLFSDDTACDVRDEYRDLVGRGASGPEATRQLIEDYYPGDSPDDTAFWLGLAATQWKLGRLEDSVRDRALRIIQDGSDLRRWEEGAPKRDVHRRRAVLEKLREQLLSPQPAPKRVRASYVQDTEFTEGDVVSYRLGSGSLILLRVVSIYVDRGGRYPVVEIADWVGVEPPPADVITRLRAKRPSPESGTEWEFTTRFMVVRWSRTDYPVDRLRLVARQIPITPLPRVEPHHPDSRWTITSWRELDGHLRDGFRL